MRTPGVPPARVKRARLHALVVLGLAALVSLGGMAEISVAKTSHRRRLHVTYVQWAVMGSTSGKRTTKPGGRVTHCSTDPVRKLRVAGRVVRAVKHETDDLVWLYDGRPAYHFKWTWLFNGNRKVSMGIAAQPPYSYPDGKYTLKLKHKGKILGTSSIRLVTDKHC